MIGRHRRSAVALLAALLAAVAALVPVGAPAGANGVPFTTRGSITQVATWGHTAGETVELLAPGGGVQATAEADAQGAVLFRNLAPAAGYAVRTDDGTSDTVEVTDPEDHPDQSFYDGIDLISGYGYLPTRDGTLLSVNIQMPIAGGSGPRPVLVVYSGYDPSNPAGLPPETLPYLLRGYVVVGVNMRGSGCSGGAFDYYEPATSTDGYDVIETVAAQDWSNGRVGMVGISYSGVSQMYVAATQPPSLRAITPLSPYADAGRGILYPGGIRNEGFALEWALDRQAASAPAARPWAKQRIQQGDTVCAANQVLRLQSRDLEAEITPTRYDTDEYQNLSISTFVDRIEVPTYLAVQFQDEQTGGSAVTLAEALQADGKPFRAVFGNGAHADPLGPTELPRVMEFVDFYVGQQVPDTTVLQAVLPGALGPVFDSPIDVPPNRFDPSGSFEDALAAYEAEQPVRVRYEVGGVPGLEGAPYATATRSYDAWPIPGTQVERWYLQPDGGLGTSAPTVPDDSPRATSAYRYAPGEGRPDTFVGGDLWHRHPDVEWESPAEDTALTFTTPPATETSIYAGTGSVDLWVRSTAADTDLEAVLTEVRPDGQEVFVQSGWLRASQRALDATRSTPLAPWPTHREADAAPLPAGELVPLRLAMFPFAHVVRPGSSLRLSIEAPGGNQPLWAFTALGDPGTNEVGHSVGRPSSVALPLVTDPDGVAELPEAAPSCAVEGVTTQSQSLRLQPCRDDRAPRRATGVTLGVAAPGADDVRVTWTAPAVWSDGAVPTGYEVELLPSGTTATAPAGATEVVIPDLPRGTALSAVVTPQYAGGGGVPSTPSLAFTVPAASTATQSFVQAGHADFLDRAPTPGELASISELIDGGDLTRRAWLQQVAASDEWVGAIVDRLYLDTLGRPGDAAGREYWIDAIASGRLGVARVAASFYASAEYFQGIGGGTPESWVADLYGKLVGRSGGPDEVAYWVEQAGLRGRGWVALRMFQAPESAADRVVASYQVLLGRSPSAADVAFWAPRIVRTGDIALAVDLAASAEYLARAQARFP